MRAWPDAVPMPHGVTTAWELRRSRQHMRIAWPKPSQPLMQRWLGARGAAWQWVAVAALEWALEAGGRGRGGGGGPAQHGWPVRGAGQRCLLLLPRLAVLAAAAAVTLRRGELAAATHDLPWCKREGGEREGRAGAG